ncbi:LA [Enterospora canceri]|uniref:LA n=1 Tax=Enterospora canceri TaxID=1081671 RepID=A0A1Y1S9D7_9MICR|nr:LA [Enterospora canceri]
MATKAKKNTKTKTKEEKGTSTIESAKIKRQVEYYFSNANFSKDKFLYEIATQNSGKVDINVLLTFNRLKQMNATVEGVKEAVKNSPNIKIEGDSLIKTDIESLKTYKNESVNDKTVAMLGFDTEMNLDDIDAFLRSKCNPSRILMRRRKNKAFSGTCFVEFETVEEAKAALELEFEVAQEEGDDETKKAKVAPKHLKIITKDEHLKNCEENSKVPEIEKIKNDFIPKMYKLTGVENMEEAKIADIKKKINNAAFVDLKKSVVRMKFVEDWNEMDFEGLKLVKMSEEEATEYVNNLDIKVKKNNKKK